LSVIHPGGTGESQRGEAQLSSLLANIVELLENPIVAVLLGLAFAAGLLVTSRQSTKLLNADNPEAGLALAAISLFGRLAAATLVLWAYKRFAPSGLKPFALALAGGFVVMYTIELVRYAGVRRNNAPAGARR